MNDIFKIQSVLSQFTENLDLNLALITINQGNCTFPVRNDLVCVEFGKQNNVVKKFLITQQQKYDK